MSESEHLTELDEKISIQREKLNVLVLEGLEREDLLNLSCELDNLINEYYKHMIDNKNSHKI